MYAKLGLGCKSFRAVDEGVGNNDKSERKGEAGNNVAISTTTLVLDTVLLVRVVELLVLVGIARALPLAKLLAVLLGGAGEAKANNADREEEAEDKTNPTTKNDHLEEASVERRRVPSGLDTVQNGSNEHNQGENKRKHSKGQGGVQVLCRPNWLKHVCECEWGEGGEGEGERKGETGDYVRLIFSSLAAESSYLLVVSPAAFFVVYSLQ